MSPQMQSGNRRQGMSLPSPSSIASSSLELVEEYPMASTLLAFGVGLGVGVLVGQTIAGALRQESPRSPRLDSLSQQVCDAVRNAVPDAISRHFGR
jgi:hypothetical protein